MILALAGIVFATGFSPAVVTPGDAATWAVSREYLSGLRQPQAPEVSAAGYIVVNPTTGRIVLAHEEHARLAPASLTKIMTFMTAMSVVSSGEDGRDLQTSLRTIKADFYPYSAIGMAEGEIFTLEELLYILLVPSDNAAAVTIARSLGGSEEAFVGEMNALAAEWGLVDTRFVNAHGLDAGGQYASPYDLAILSRAAMANPLFAEIVRHVQVDKGGYRLPTTNELLSAYPGSVGIKTGTTAEAGQCLIGWVQRPSGTALVVVMGSQDRIGDSTALFDYFFTHEVELALDLPRSALNRYRDAKGNLHEFTIEHPVVFLVHPWERGSLRYVRRLWQLPEEPSADEPLGALEVWLNGRLLTELPLYGRP